MNNKSETKHTCCGGRQNFWLWLGALAVGSCLGFLGVEWVNTMANFVATIFTRLFQFIAVPTIALAVTTTLATFGMQRETGGDQWVVLRLYDWHRARQLPVPVY